MKKIQRTQLHLTLIYFVPIFFLIVGLAVFVMKNQRIIADEIRYSFVFVGDSVVENESLLTGTYPDGVVSDRDNSKQQYAAFDFSDDGEVNMEYLSLDEYDKAIDDLYGEILIWILGIVPLLLVFFAYLSYRLSGWILQPLIQNQEQQKRFIDDASHELRTPVSLMRLELDMEKQRKEQKTDRQQKMILNLNHSVNQLESIIQALLAYVRVGSFEQELETENLSASQIADEIFSQFEESFQDKNIHATKNIDPHISLKTNNNLLRQMLTIGMDNALKHNYEKGNIIFELQQNKKGLVFQIKNTTKHIDKIDFEKITERFYRANTARTESGMGLGLSIAQSIAQKLGGTLLFTREDDFFVFEYRT